MGKRGSARPSSTAPTVNEKIDISANGTRAKLTRDVANITMDLNSMETIDVAAKGGADTLTVDDLTGAGVKNVNLDLGGADGDADTVVINATGSDDTIFVSSGGVITVVGSLGDDHDHWS
jgi:hypothetical protein